MDNKDNQQAAIIHTLTQSRLFQQFETHQFDEILPLFNVEKYKAGEVITHEGDKTRHLYLIHEGKVEVVKGDLISDATTFQMSILQQGDNFGEIAALDPNNKRTASIRALTDCTLLSIHSDALDALTQKQKNTVGLLMRNIAKDLASRLTVTTDMTVNSLKRELDAAKTRITMGKFIVYTSLLITLYAIAVSGFSSMAAGTNASTLVSVPIITIFAIVLFIMMLQSGYPLATYGLTLVNWKKSIGASLLWSCPVMALIVLIKWVMIHTIPMLKGDPLFILPHTIHTIRTSPGPENWLPLTGYVLAYTIFVPMQELAARGALQSSLERFLVGRFRIFWAVFISATSFAATHTHLSMTIALAVLPLGIFWGILYYKQRTLIAPIVSHIIIGWWAFFIVGLERIA